MNPTAAIFKNKWFWIILVLLIIAVVVYKNGGRWLQKLRNRDRGSYAGQGNVNDNPQRKAELEQLTRDLYTAMDGLPAWNDVRPELFERALGANDTELRHIADFYKQLSNGESLSTAVSSEWVIGDAGTRLVARLRTLNL